MMRKMRPHIGVSPSFLICLTSLHSATDPSCQMVHEAIWLHGSVAELSMTQSNPTQCVDAKWTEIDARLTEIDVRWRSM